MKWLTVDKSPVIVRNIWRRHFSTFSNFPQSQKFPQVIQSGQKFSVSRFRALHYFSLATLQPITATATAVQVQPAKEKVVVWSTIDRLTPTVNLQKRTLSSTYTSERSLGGKILEGLQIKENKQFTTWRSEEEIPDKIRKYFRPREETEVCTWPISRQKRSLKVGNKKRT